jgi:hypothetical protein
MISVAEPGLSIIRLTRREREELANCEQDVGETISEFLRCGRALSKIRNGRLYRETHATFDQYVVERWGMKAGAADTLITSFRIAEQLEESGIDVPSSATQSAMRSLQSLPPIEGLRAAVWRFSATVCPGAGCPTLSILRRVSTIIRDALDNVDGAGNPVDEDSEEEAEETTEGRPSGNGNSRKKRPPRTASGEERFLRAAMRMATYPGFSVPLITSQVRSSAMARHIYEVCERLKVRLDQVEAAIENVPRCQNPKSSLNGSANAPHGSAGDAPPKC